VKRTKRRRRHISLMTKLAAVLLVLHPEDRERAKQMTAKQYVRSKQLEWEWDHIELHALGGSDHFTNLTPMPFAEHREKSRRDTSIVAKVKRLRTDWQGFKLLSVKKAEAKYKRVYKWPKRKIPSRPFRQRRSG
jgi:hypothetical protein